jgi:hypothetical protein
MPDLFSQLLIFMKNYFLTNTASEASNYEMYKFIIFIEKVKFLVTDSKRLIPPRFQDLSGNQSYVKGLFLELKGKNCTSPLPPKSYYILASDRCRQGRHEVVKDLVAENFVAAGVGPQVNGDNPVPGGTFGPWAILYDQHALLSLLSKQKVARNGLLFGLGELYRVVGFENDEFEVNFLPHTGEGDGATKNG